MATLFSNIGTLANVRDTYCLLRGRALAELPCISNAYLVVEGGVITDYGAMADLKQTETLFFDKTGMDKKAVDRIVSNALTGCDDGELYLEYTQSESFPFLSKSTMICFGEGIRQCLMPPYPLIWSW